MKDKRKAYEEKLDAQLREWRAQNALLKVKADVKIDYYRSIDTLQRKQDEGRRMLQEFKTAGG